MIKCIFAAECVRFSKFKGSDQRESRRVWSNINTGYLYGDVVMGILFSFVEAAILYG
jgi:hypothetical protein